MDKKILEHLTIAALQLIAIRPQSKWELTRKLTKSAQAIDIPKEKIHDYITEILDTLSVQGHVNDSAFAVWYADQRLSFRPRSKRRLKVELGRKGVDSTTIASALEEYDEKMACLKIIDKKKAYSREKLIVHLKREGFSWDTIESCLDDEF